jgi:hypothetical protein
MISRLHRGLHAWVRQAPRSFKIIVLDIIFLKWSLDHANGHTSRYGKHIGASRSPYWNFSLNTKYKLIFRSLSTRQHERSLLAQEAHTSLKSYYELNIWQMISLLKVRLLRMRIIEQVAKQVSKEIKALIHMINKSN